MKTHTRGFTLLEVLATTAVAGVLAGVALPSFQHQMHRGKRIDAIGALTKLEFAQGSYQANNGIHTTDLAALGMGSGLTPEGLYQLTVTKASATGYTAHASAVAGRSQQGDKACATLTLNVEGAQVTRGPSLACWNR